MAKDAAGRSLIGAQQLFWSGIADKDAEFWDFVAALCGPRQGSSGLAAGRHR